DPFHQLPIQREPKTPRPFVVGWQTRLKEALRLPTEDVARWNNDRPTILGRFAQRPIHLLPDRQLRFRVVQDDVDWKGMVRPIIEMTKLPAKDVIVPALVLKIGWSALY